MGQARTTSRQPGVIAVLLAAMAVVTIATMLPASIAAAVPAAVATAATDGQSFTPVASRLLYDTRAGLGGTGRVGAGQARDVVVAGAAGVPSNATVVALTVTADDPTGAGHLTVFAAGNPRPATSNVNYVSGRDASGLVFARVGAGGKVTISNTGGSTHLRVDLSGYFGPAASSRFSATGPVRVVDTRSGLGGSSAPVTAGTNRAVDLTTGAVPSTATAVLVNITAVAPSAAGSLAVRGAGEAAAAAQHVSFGSGQTIANLVVASVGAGGMTELSVSAGRTHVVLDVVGYFAPSPTGTGFNAAAPARILDTRSGRGGPAAALTAGETRSLTVNGGSVPAGATAVALNVTVTAPTGASHLTVWPTGVARPTVSSLNYVTGQTVPNFVVVAVGSGGQIQLRNNSGSAHVIADVVGWFGPAVASVAPVNTALPAITGTVQVSRTLSATAGSWNGSPTSYAYRWQRCAVDGTACSVISGATAAAYVATAADQGRALRVAVTASNVAGSTTATSPATHPVSAAPAATGSNTTVGVNVDAGYWGLAEGGNAGVDREYGYGQAGDRALSVALAGGRKLPALFRPSTNEVLVGWDGNGFAQRSIVFGAPTHQMIGLDTDGNGTDELLSYDPATATAYWRATLSSGGAERQWSIGMPGDKVFGADVDANGGDELVLVRGNTLYVTAPFSGAQVAPTITYGESYMTHLAVEQGGRDRLAAYDPASGTVHVRSSWTSGYGEMTIATGIGYGTPVPLTEGIGSGAPAPLRRDRSADFRFFAAINAERARLGRPQLEWNEALAASTCAHSASMQASGGLFHAGGDELGASGYAVSPTWVNVGENVGYGPSVTSLVSAFFASTDHYENLTASAFDAYGSCTYAYRDRLWTTHRFVDVGAP